MDVKKLEQVLYENKMIMLSILKKGNVINDDDIDLVRELIIKAYDFAAQEAIVGHGAFSALEKVVEANGLDMNDANSQVYLDFYHFMKMDEAERAKRAKGERYIFGDPDKPEKKTEETTHNPG